jgi:hypothetical protein
MRARAPVTLEAKIIGIHCGGQAKPRTRTLELREKKLS